MKIGIIGASSQVGSSLALYLKYFTDADPVCFVRSAYSKVFFDITGITCSEVNLNDVVALKNAFSTLNVVIDCTYPSGQLYEIPASIEQNLARVIEALPKSASFIYMSTIMAFGMPTGHRQVEHFTVPQTTYAFIKRKAEEFTNSFCTEHGIKGYNFRLGQVHGFLQSVNGSYREKFRTGVTIRVNASSNDLSNVIFIPTLADAIVKVLKAEIEPGLYSLVNEPQWTLKELHDYYLAYYQFANDIDYSPDAERNLGVKTKAALGSSLRRWRPLLESYFLMKRPRLYAKVKGRYRVSEVAKASAVHATDYTDFHLIGRNPGRLINGLECSVADVLTKEREMEHLYDGLLEKATQSMAG